MNGYDLSRLFFQGRNLARAQLAGAQLQLTDLRQCDLTDANLHDCKLHSARLEGADVTRTDFTSADFTRCALSYLRARDGLPKIRQARNLNRAEKPADQETVRLFLHCLADCEMQPEIEPWLRDARAVVTGWVARP